jgi:hypothetical protein
MVARGAERLFVEDGHTRRRTGDHGRLEEATRSAERLKGPGAK